MIGTNRLKSTEEFTTALFKALKTIQPGLENLAFYEFRYALENYFPEEGWEKIQILQKTEIEQKINTRAFYESIEHKPKIGDRIVLDRQIFHLNQVLFAGLVSGQYSAGWVKTNFYFDLRGFFFVPRNTYFTEDVLTHLGRNPYRSFEPKQMHLDRYQGIGYLDFMRANEEIDCAFIECIQEVIDAKGTPILITLAGPTAAGKTEITERLLIEFAKKGQKITTIEVDNFLLDRDIREDKPMGKESTHFDIFVRSLEEILKGHKIQIPRYDFVYGTSSHDLRGNLKPGCISLEIEPADIILMEGNFPFHIDEISRLIGIKVVYLTDDPIRLKRKWKRDIDYRKKYDPAYFQNRYFKTQFLRADEIYRPLMSVSEMVVDTTGAALWITPEIKDLLE
jgi:uridine kinase